MHEIWKSPVWPNLTYDPAAVEAALARATESSGDIGGMFEGLGPEDREGMRLHQIVQEVVASFGIEGVSLDAAQIEASVVASMAVRDKGPFSRRSHPNPC